jgi:hypothetical protein
MALFIVRCTLRPTRPESIRFDHDSASARTTHVIAIASELGTLA